MLLAGIEEQLGGVGRICEETTFTGAPELTMVRGNVIVENGELVPKPGVGRFVRRARFSP